MAIQEALWEAYHKEHHRLENFFEFLTLIWLRIFFVDRQGQESSATSKNVADLERRVRSRSFRGRKQQLSLPGQASPSSNQLALPAPPASKRVFQTAVIVVPPMSRARHVGDGHWPLPSRAHPLGLPSLSAADCDRVLRSNQVLWIASWVCYVTLRSKRFTYFLLIMPEDFGFHRLSGPASPWNL